MSGQHRDVARLQRRIETGVFEQRAQLVVQHFDLALRRVAAVELQAGVARVHFGAPRHGWDRIAIEQVALQLLQQAVALRRGVSGDLAGRMHHVVTAQHRHEITACRAPGLQQRVVAASRLVECIAVGLQALAQRAQVAPVLARRRRQVEMQHARPRLRGDHAQHVRRDIEAGEREHARRQVCRSRGILPAVAPEIFVDAARTMRLSTGDVAPQGGLRIVRRRAFFPRQQPVTPPRLVLLEHLREFTRQRPGTQRIGVVEIPPQRRQRRLAQHGRVGQRRVQAPVQAGGVEFRAVAAGQVRIERLADEFARRQEPQVGRDPVRARHRHLQPAPHRRLRNQDRVGREQRHCGCGRAQFLGQQPGQHVQRIAVVEAEVGGVVRRAHHERRMMPEPRRSRGDPCRSG